MRPSIAAVCALLCVAASACLAADQDDSAGIEESDKIRGGRLATAGEFPSVVFISGSGTCTGTLIGPDVVLTAAHCVTAHQDYLIFLDTLEPGRDDHPTRAKLRHKVRHPAYVWGDNAFSNFSNDVGLLFLSQPLHDHAISPLVGSDLAKHPALVAFVGYGRSSSSDEVGGVLKVAERQSIRCENLGIHEQGLMCFGSAAFNLDFENATGLKGDSGGPVFIRTPVQQLVAVHVGGGEVDGNAYSFGARVYPHLQWISQTVVAHSLAK